MRKKSVVCTKKNIEILEEKKQKGRRSGYRRPSSFITYGKNLKSILNIALTWNRTKEKK